MSPIQLTVLAGVLILITAMNLKIAIWYIDRKQAKQALQNYSNQEQSDNTTQVQIPFTLAEIKCVDSIANNIDQYLDALTSQKLEKIGIMKDDTLMAVMIPIERYEKLLEYVSPVQDTTEGKVKL
ncbi:hypothetical protein [Sulfurospirillum multivorans]|uniref:Uncharacterized protein n=2 Tax=Sulfurospirillum multivorans TaxID=66821 RepID=A0AA86DX75_SULMK|nr:hypothetical protein [Sulfurospirillum multivorans]AHJ11708.1 hypothetical protein SMUL_0427 [Sulfurospirillum multivorans DSM 12446]QEH05214.1 hypothetical protein SMN_0426 [Sulfurospirillum multivorans]